MIRISVVISCLIAAATLALTAPPSSASSGGQLTQAQLNVRLLRTGDLPGWGNYVFRPNFPNWSDRLSCLNAIDGLDSPIPPRGVTQAAAAFAQSVSGPWILQTLRSYPGQGAAQAFHAAIAVLAGCSFFHLAWNNPPESATETIQPVATARLGNQSWSAAITEFSAVPQDETLIFVQVGHSIMLLEIDTTDTVPMPTLAQATAIAARAVGKLSR